MKLYKTKWFERTARKKGISDSSLWNAVRRAQKGLVDADLGGHLISNESRAKGRGSRVDFA